MPHPTRRHFLRRGALSSSKLSVSVKDRQGNLSRIGRSFSVGAAAPR